MTHTRNTTGLTPFSPAPDQPKDLVLVSVKIEAQHKAILLATPEGLSYHVRQALKQYFQSPEEDLRSRTESPELGAIGE